MHIFPNRAKQITPCERAWNTVPENSVRNCVHFCLQPLVSLERCKDAFLSFLNVLSPLVQSLSKILVCSSNQWVCEVLGLFKLAVRLWLIGDYQRTTLHPHWPQVLSHSLLHHSCGCGSLLFRGSRDCINENALYPVPHKSILWTTGQVAKTCRTIFSKFRLDQRKE